MSPPSRVVAVALLLVGMAAVVSAPVVGLASQDASADQPVSDQVGEEPDVRFAAELQVDGDARWNITTTVPLETESQIEAYRSEAAEFEEGELPPLGYETFEVGVAGVDGQTDREMELTDFVRKTATEQEIENGVGRFTVEFTWENFMRKTDNQLLIDRDVLVMETGALWLPELTRSQTLRITAPSGYGVRSSTVAARDGVLMWKGPTTFNERSLQATFIGTGDLDENDTNDGNGTDQPSERSGVFPWLLIPIAAVGIAVAVLLTRGDQLQIELPTDLGAGNVFSAGGTAASTEQETAPDSDGGPMKGESDQEPDDEEIDTELLSDEERVERLLSSNGGRMKQADIVKETDWSNAKVSQLLSSMEEEGRIDKLRIGRENLISFPDEDITDSEE